MKKRGLSDVATTLILVIVAVLLASVASYYAVDATIKHEKNESVGTDIDEILWDISFRKVIGITLCNGTHLIQSVIVYDSGSNDVVDQYHCLLKIDDGEYKILGHYEILGDIPSYKTFLPSSSQEIT